MSNETELKLPELHQTELDPEMVQTLFADLESCAEILAVIPKYGPGYIAVKSINLAEGERALKAGELRGLQVRYRYQGDEWWDTLIASGANVRITRIKHEFRE